MASVLGHAHYDDVKETTTTVGTGDRVLAGASVGFRALSTTGIADGTVVPASIRGGAEFETGLYRYNSGANSLTPVELTVSSNANAIVNFSAGSKDVTIGPLARHIIDPIPAWPFSTAQTLLRLDSILSPMDFTNRGYVKKWYDISGNGNDSATNTTNPPRFLARTMYGLPALYFNFAHRLTFPGVPQIASPFKACIVGVGSDWGASGNSHIYNWAGNPIGFSATTGLEFIYNGTLPSAHSDSQAIVQDQRPDGWLGHPVAFLHYYDGANSINSVNGVEQVVNTNIGTGASGTTNSFTIGGDSSTGGGSYVRMALSFFAVLNFLPNATQRGYLYSYMRARGRLAFV